ncbi:MAG: hypothetical protein ABI678_17395 [Kofleriaceae bacterium]
MERRLQRELAGLEGRLDPASSQRTIDELAQIRRELGDSAAPKPAFELPNVRLGFACKQRWDDMVGDDRVRACAGCDRPVFNLSEMTREEASRVLATRGLTPCVRFYRRPDGTVMTTDCPTGTRREGRRLAVVASSLAAGTALASPSARAEPAPTETTDAAPDATTGADPASEQPATTGITIDTTPMMGIPLPDRDFEMGVIEAPSRPERTTVEWSVWARIGMGAAASHPTVLARGLTPPEVGSAPMWEAALAAEVTLPIGADGNVRLGAWGEVRTSSGAVAGGELVVEGFPARAFGGSGSVVLRAGGNPHVVTGALGFGITGAWPSDDPWVHWASHVVGARFVTSVNHSLDDPRDWSVTLGVEVEPIGALHAALDLVTDP